MQEVILYTIHCPKCDILEKKLNEKNIKYEICDDAEKMLSLGFEQAPILKVNGVVHKFKEAVDWVKEQ